MAIRDIGQVNIAINGVEYLLHPSFACWAEVEDRCGVGIMKIAESITTGNIKATYIVGILWGGIYGAAAEQDKKPDITYKKFCDECVEHGIQNVLQDTVIFFSKALTGKQKKTLTEVQL